MKTRQVRVKNHQVGSTRYLLAFALAALCLLTVGTGHGGQNPNVPDPMIRISCLPITKSIDTVLAAISTEVSKETGIEEKYITYYWQTLDAIWSMGKKPAEGRILVDLYVPGFFTNKKIATLMESLVVSIEKNVGIDRQWIFIQTHFPNQGQVILSGKVQVWDDYQGPANTDEFAKKSDTIQSLAPSVDW